LSKYIYKITLKCFGEVVHYDMYLYKFHPKINKLNYLWTLVIEIVVSNNKKLMKRHNKLIIHHRLCNRLNMN